MEGNDDGERRELGNLPAVVRPHQMRSSLQGRQRRGRDAPKLLQDPRKGQVQNLRSRNNAKKSYVKFCNGTSRNVVLYWIDYEGQAVSFGTLPSGVCVDIDTYVTHPWIFVDEETGDRLMVEQKDVYFPEPPENYFVGGVTKPGRSVVSIMTRIPTLQEMASKVIMRHLQNEDQVCKLEIPVVLMCELKLKMKFTMWEEYFKNQTPYFSVYN